MDQMQNITSHARPHHRPAHAEALAKLKAEGFKPRRDIVLFFTGDEETMMNGALRGSTEWKPLLDAEFALNADGGGGAFDKDGRPLGFGLDAAEKYRNLPYVGVLEG